MFSQLVQDILRAVGSWEGQFWAVVREIADGLNILEGPGIWAAEEWTAGRRRGLWALSSWLGGAFVGLSPADPVCLDSKAKPFCHAELIVQKSRRTEWHCYLSGLFCCKLPKGAAVACGWGSQCGTENRSQRKGRLCMCVNVHMSYPEDSKQN